MKPFIKLLVLTLFLSIDAIFSQEVNMQNFINKSLKDVAAVMGKPVYQDHSDPKMICTFYKSKTTRYAFVSNSKGIFQAEACLSYPSKNEAEKIITNLIKSCKSDGYSSDTLAVNNYCVSTIKIKLEISSSKNGATNMYDVRIKATRRE